MYDNYSMPDPRFYKLYANKIRDMPSLRTDDIEGAKPKKMVFDRNDFVNDYYHRKQAAIPKLAPQNLNYWPNPRKGAGALNPNVRHSTDFMKPDDYPLPKDYSIANHNVRQSLDPREYQAPYFNQAYQNQAKQQSSIRNPMYSDFDYNQYSNNKYPGSPQKAYIEDSLDALQYQYGGYNPHQQQQQQQQQQPQVQEFKKDWLNFYGVETGGNQASAKRLQQQQNPVPETLASKAQNDINLKANAANFYGGGLSEDEQFQKNVNAFFADTMTTEPRGSRRREDAFKPELKLYNPLTRAPMLHYQKDIRKFEQPKEMSIKEQWQFKKNAERFFAA